MNTTPLLMARGCKRGTKKQERLFITMRYQQWGQTSPCSFHLSKVLLRRSTSTLDIYFHFLIFLCDECLSGIWFEPKKRKILAFLQKKKNCFVQLALLHFLHSLEYDYIMPQYWFSSSKNAEPQIIDCLKHSHVWWVHTCHDPPTWGNTSKTNSGQIWVRTQPNSKKKKSMSCTFLFHI